MPINLKQNTFKYKDPSTGEYKSVDTIGEVITYDAEAYAKGTRNNITITDINDPAFEKNAKHYADLAQAANNSAQNLIGAAAGAVRYDTEQQLTAVQQEQARQNIGGASIEQVNDLKDDFSDLSNKVDTKIGFENSKNVTYFNMEDDAQWGDAGLSNTRRWFFNKIFSAGFYLDKIAFSVNRSTQERIIYIEIWEKVGDTLTKVKTVQIDTAAPTVQQIAEKHIVDLNYETTKDCMVSVISANNNIIYERLNNTTNTILSSSDITLSTETINYSTLGTWYMDVAATIYCTINSKINIVTIGPGMDYEEIQDALIDISDDSATNPYTLLLMPKGKAYKPFSMLRNAWSDVYPWSGVNPRYISIIGVDKERCIVRSDSGNYKMPCGELLVNGIIKNIKFIMTNDNQDPAATQGGYCLHIDCRTNNDVGYNMVIEDCEFEDSSGPCLGIGMHKNCTLTIRRCNFHTTLSNNYSPHQGYTNLVNYGVVFCHTSTLADSTNQKINIEDCTGLCDEGTKGLWISTAGDYNPSTSSFYYKLIRNVFWNTTQNAPAYSISSTLTEDPMTFGNNIPD